MKPKSLKQKIALDIYAIQYRDVFHDLITDSLKQELYRNISNYLYNDSKDYIINWELSQQIENEAN
jgi:hypothetical protein